MIPKGAGIGHSVDAIMIATIVMVVYKAIWNMAYQLNGNDYETKQTY